VPFESPDWPLGELLEDIHHGKIQLPDFQREWKWDVDRIRSLLASIGQGHPVGVVMMLQSGGDAVSFATRPIAGVDGSATATPERLLLDGQQRLTSLYQSLFGGFPVETTDARGKRLSVWFYLDIAKALDPEADLEDDALLVTPADRLVKENFGRDIVADYTSLEKECAAGVFPLSKAFDQGFPLTYYVECGKQSPELADAFMRFNEGPLTNFKKYLVPVIELTKETPREAVCTVFEKVNTGGVALNVFELLTATFASGGEDFRLNDDWKERKARMIAARPVLASVQSTDFLQAVSLLASRKRRRDWAGAADKTPGISCKRKDILGLTLDQYREWAEPLTEAFIWAGEFLNQEHIFRAKDLPYGTQLVPLAALRVVLGADAELLGTRQRLERWYWCGVLGELYGGAVETRFARDLEQVEAWVHGGDEPGSVAGASFNPDRLLTLRTRISAAYKGLYALTMRGTVSDWMKHKTLDQTTFFDYAVDIHHIFPQAWCKKNGVEWQRADSIINKTPLARETNLFISGRAPSTYLPALAKKAGVEQSAIHELLVRHHVDPDLLATDDFDAFFADRRSRLLSIIEQAMGKPVLGEDVPLEEFDPEEPDATEEPEAEAA
jgi:hypothetical protein